MGKLGRRHASMLLVGAALIAAGCGDDEDDAEQAAEAVGAAEAADEVNGATESDTAVFDTDPCELLTDTDIEALLGESVKGDLQVEGDAATGQPGQCFWELGGSVDLAAPNAKPFSVSVSAGDQAWFENSRALVGEDESFEELDVDGNEAFAGNTRAGVLIEGAGLTVELGISADPASHEVALDALDRVVANY